MSNYYEVKAKCGHVGKNNYIIKSFYVYAASGSEAALITRKIPRVKHDRKDAIVSVTKITEEEYEQGINKNSNDLYFQVSNKQDQTMYCDGIDQLICKEEEQASYKRCTHKKRYLLETIIKKEYLNERMMAYEY